MNIILTDYRKLKKSQLNDYVLIHVDNNIQEFNHNRDVVAIVGSRALAITANKVDFPSLKLVQLTSAGFDGVSCEDYARKRIAVANAGSIYSAPIAETVILGLLLIAKKLHSNPNNRHAKLQRHYSTITEIAGKRIIILGTGNIGTAVAARLQGFEATIDGYNRTLKNKPQFSRIITDRKELEQTIGKYDYIISTLPATSETERFIDSKLISLMSKNAVVVNVGRRSVIDENALYSALRSNDLGGAVLDMFELIPNPIQNKFRRLKNTIVLPGVAAISQEVDFRLRELIQENITALVTGNEIKYVVNGV